LAGVQRVAERDGLHGARRRRVGCSGLGIVGLLARLGARVGRGCRRSGGRLGIDTLRASQTEDETGGNGSGQRRFDNPPAHAGRRAAGPPKAELVRAHAKAPPNARAQPSKSTADRRNACGHPNVPVTHIAATHVAVAHWLRCRRVFRLDRGRQLFSAIRRAASTVDAISTDLGVQRGATHPADDSASRLRCKTRVCEAAQRNRCS
jgi:hypothetical protein